MVYNLISFFAGFLFSSIFDTTLAEFQEWAIIGTAFIVASIETVSKIFYSTTTRFLNTPYTRFMSLGNYLKMGLIYGLIVDSFKLGS